MTIPEAIMIMEVAEIMEEEVMEEEVMEEEEEIEYIFSYLHII